MSLTKGTLYTTFLREIFTKSGTLAFRHFYHHLLVYTTAGTVSGKFMHTSRCRSIFDFHILLSGTAVELCVVLSSPKGTYTAHLIFNVRKRS